MSADNSNGREGLGCRLGGALLVVALGLQAGTAGALDTSETGDVADQFFRYAHSEHRGTVQGLGGDEVDPFTGNLRIVREDLYLPGVAGHDLHVLRTYSSKLWGRTDFNGANDAFLAELEPSVLGYGWTFHFGRLRNPNGSGQVTTCSNDLPVFETPDGNSRVFYPEAGGGTAFVSRDYWRLERPCSQLGVQGACVWSDTGVRYELDVDGHGYVGAKPVWSVTAIRDTFGNAIRATYLPGSGLPSNVTIPPVDHVTDTYGRVVSFSYSYGVDGARLTTMTANGKDYRYDYTSKGPADVPGDTTHLGLPGQRRFLTKFTPPAGPSVSYDYGYSKTPEQGQFALSNITYPNGGKVDYLYSMVPVCTGAVATKMSLVWKRTVTSAPSEVGAWTYEYSIPLPGGSTAIDPVTNLPVDLNVTTITGPDGVKETHRFVGFASASNLAQQWPASHGGEQGRFVWAVGLPVEISKGDRSRVERFEHEPLPAISDVLFSPPSYAGPSGCIAIESAYLQEGGVAPAALAKRTIYTDPDASNKPTASFETVYSDFDAFGQARLVAETGRLAQSLSKVDQYGTTTEVPLQHAGTRTRTTTLTYSSVERDGANQTLNLLRGRPLSQTLDVDGDHVVTTWTYDGVGRSNDTKTEAGITTRFQRHTSTTEGPGNLHLVTNAEDEPLELSGFGAGGSCDAGCGVPTLAHFNGTFVMSREAYWEGWVKSETNGRGNTTYFTYDAIGRPETVTPPNPQRNAATSYEWAADNSSVMMRRGTYWKRTKLDGLARQVGTDDSNLVSTSVAYDLRGRRWFESYPYVTGEADPLGVRNAFDNADRVKSTSRGFRKSYTSPHEDFVDSYARHCATQTAIPSASSVDDQVTLWCFASFGDPDEKRVAAVADALGNIWQFGSTVTGNPSSVTAPLGAGERNYVYFPDTKLLQSEATGESGTVTYTYNALGQVETRRDATGVVATFQYDDPRDRLTSVTYQARGYQGSEDLTRLQDPSNNVTDIESGSGGAFHLDYDELERLTGETWDFGPKVFQTAYRFDANGCLDAMTYPTGDVVGQACDSGNRVTSMTLNGAPLLGPVEYHPAGMPLTVRFEDLSRTTTTTVYDDYLRTWSVSAPGFLGLSYTYDYLDNVKTLTDSAGAGGSSRTSRRLFYDKLNRLLWVEAPYMWGTAAYDYDELGNRTLKSDTSTTVYEYDGANRLDAAWITGTETIAPMTLSWSVTGTLASTSDGASYKYDGRGRRIQKTVGGVSTLYHYDHAGRIIAETDPTGEKQRIFIYLGNRLAVVDGCAAGAAAACPERQWYFTDALGSVLARSDATGSIEPSSGWAARLAYQPWGERWKFSGVPGDRQYNGRIFDLGTGFHDYGARMYWPQIGRFISADSVMGEPGNPASLNRYSYVLNNPCKYTDATGHCPMCIGAGIGAVVGGVGAGMLSYNAGVRGWDLVGDVLFGVGAGGLAGSGVGALVGAATGGGVAAAAAGGGAALAAGRNAPAVTLDTNALIAGIEGGEAAAVDSAMAGRVPLVPIQAAKEFFRGGGDVGALRDFLTARGGGVGPAVSESSVAGLQAKAGALGRALSIGDARIAGSAAQSATSVMTRDARFGKTLEAVGQTAEKF
jgi:RHS repeat-associated protein